MSLPFGNILPETPDYSVKKKPGIPAALPKNEVQSVYPGLDDITSRTYIPFTVNTQPHPHHQTNMGQVPNNTPYVGFYNKGGNTIQEETTIIKVPKEPEQLPPLGMESKCDNIDNGKNMELEKTQTLSFITPLYKHPHRHLDVIKKRIITIPFVFSAAYLKRVGDLGACVVEHSFKELREAFGREMAIMSKPKDVDKATWISSVTSKYVNELASSSVLLVHSIRVCSSWNTSPFNMALYLQGMPCDIASIDGVHCTFGARRNHCEAYKNRYIIAPPNDTKVYEMRASELGILNPLNITTKMAMVEPKKGALVAIKRDSPYMKAILQHKDKFDGISESELVTVLNTGTGDFATVGTAAHKKLMDTISEIRSKDLNVFDENLKIQFVRTHGATDDQEFKVDKRFRNEDGEFSKEIVEKLMEMPYECGIELELECRFIL